MKRSFKSLTDSQLADVVEILDGNYDSAEAMSDASGEDLDLDEFPDVLPETPTKRPRWNLTRTNLFPLRSSTPEPPTPTLKLVATSPSKQNEPPDIQEIILEDPLGDSPASSLQQTPTRNPTVQPPAVPKKTGGRAKSDIWNHFDQVADLDRTWECKFCTQAFKCPQPNRMQNHLDKCTKYQQSIRKRSVPVSAPTAVPVPGTSKNARQSTIDESYPKTSPALQEQLDETLVEVICATNTPFNIVEHDCFIRWAKLMRKTYEVPHRRQVGGVLLEKVYAKKKGKLNTYCEGKNATILQDGWKTPQGECVIAHSFCIDGKNFYFNSHVMGEERKTAENCFRLLENTILEAQGMGLNIIGCVTDNCNTMIAMKRLLANKYPDIFTLGCNAHLFNLVGKKLTPLDIMKKIVDVQKFMSNHDLPRAALVRLKGKAPDIPGDTRWNSQLDSVGNYISNQAKYLEISRSEEIDVSEDIKAIISDMGLFYQAQELRKLLKPVADKLDLVQSDRATVADAMNCWLKLVYEDKLLDQVENDVTRKYIMDQYAIGTPICAIAAYMIHPKYRGELLPKQVKIRGRQWFSGKNRDYLRIVLSLSIKDPDLFDEDMFSEEQLSMDPIKWWTIIHSDDPRVVSASFLKLITVLLSLPASSAGIERNFSTLGAIYSDERRNRLAMDKADRICFIKNAIDHNLK